MRGKLREDHTVTLWNSTFTVPKGAALIQLANVDLVKGDLWAVESEKLLADLTGNSHDPKYRYCFIPAELVDIEGITIWSKFGLWRAAGWDELPGITDASIDTIRADLKSKGFCLTWCDVEPVAILPEYPADKEPDEVLAWVNQERKEDSHEYLFDVQMTAAIRVRAPSKEAAIALIAGIDSTTANLGAWPDGNPIVCEISSGESTLAEIDGEAV